MTPEVTSKLSDVVERTPRGFELIRFRDIYGEVCSLQQSSLAIYEQPGSSAIWLGCEKNQPPCDVTGQEVSHRMHLSVDQVKALVGHLTLWLETGSFDEAAAEEAEKERNRRAQQNGFRCPSCGLFCEFEEI